MRTPPCDIMMCDDVVRHVLPWVRAELVLRLVQNRGISQVQVARWMGLSRAAISQYMHGKRGANYGEIPEDLNPVIDLWAERMINNRKTITICDICRCVTHEEIPVEGNDHSCRNFAYWMW